MKETKDEETKKMSFAEKAQLGLAIGMNRGGNIGSGAISNAGQRFIEWKVKIKNWLGKIRS